MTLLLGLVCILFSVACLGPYNLCTLLLNFILFMTGEGHKHGRKLNKKQDWLHQKLPPKPQCLWLPAHITENITGSPDPGSPPSHRPHCTPYGSFLTSKKVEEIISIRQTEPTPSSEMWKSMMSQSSLLQSLFFLHAKPEQCLTEGKQGGQTTDLLDEVCNAPWWATMLQAYQNNTNE